MSINFKEIMQNNYDKIDKLKDVSSKIKNYFDENNFKIDNEKLKLLLSISENINNLINKYDDLFEIVLEMTDNKKLTAEEKRIKKNNQINKFINDKFMPYLIYTRLCLENSNMFT